MKTIDIHSRVWRDKVNGNSYISVRTTVDFGMETEKVLRSSFQYGDKSMNDQIALGRLIEEGLVPKGECSLWQYARNNGIIVRDFSEKALKSVVIDWGEE